MSATISETAVESLAGRVDKALNRVAQLEPEAQGVATELREALEAFHRAALVTIVTTLKADEAGKQLLFDLVDDPGVHALLVLHRIIRTSPQVRAEEALASVRPYLEGHGGDVELVAIDNGVAKVRLLGSCNGCSMSSQTLKNAVEVALVENVPEIAGIEVVPNEVESPLIGADDLMSHLRSRKDGASPPAAPAAPMSEPDLESGGWVRGPGLLEIGDPGIATYVDDAGDSFIVVQDGGMVAAYKNSCGHLGLPLDDAEIGRGRVTCDHHGHQFDLATGVGLTEAGSSLTPIPSRVEGIHVWLMPAMVSA